MAINRFDIPVPSVQPAGFYQLPFQAMAQALDRRQGLYDQNLQALAQSRIKLEESPVASILEPDVIRKQEIQDEFNQKYQQWMDADLSKLGNEIQKTVLDTYYNPDLRAIAGRAASVQAYQQSIQEAKDDQRYANWIEGPFQQSVAQYNQSGKFDRDFSTPGALPYYDVAEEAREIGSNLDPMVLEAFNNNDALVWVEGRKYVPHQYAANSIINGLSDQAIAALQAQYEYRQMLNPGETYRTEYMSYMPDFSGERPRTSVNEGAEFGDFLTQFAYTQAEQFVDYEEDISNVIKNPMYKNDSNSGGRYTPENPLNIPEGHADTQATTVDIEGMMESRDQMQSILRSNEVASGALGSGGFLTEEQIKYYKDAIELQNTAISFAMKQANITGKELFVTGVDDLFKRSGSGININRGIDVDANANDSFRVSTPDGDFLVPVQDIITNENIKNIRNGNDILALIEDNLGRTIDLNSEIRLYNPDEFYITSQPLRINEFVNGMNDNIRKQTAPELGKHMDEYHKIFSRFDLPKSRAKSIGESLMNGILTGTVEFLTMEGVPSTDKDVKRMIGSFANLNNVTFRPTDRMIDGKLVFSLMGTDDDGNSKEMLGTLPSTHNNMTFIHEMVPLLDEVAAEDPNPAIAGAASAISSEYKLNFMQSPEKSYSIATNIERIVPTLDINDSGRIYGMDGDYIVVRSNRGYVISPILKGSNEPQLGENDEPIKYIVRDLTDLKVKISEHEQANHY